MMFLLKNWKWLLPSLAFTALAIAAAWGWSLADARKKLADAQEQQIAAYAEGIKQIKIKAEKTDKILLAREATNKKTISKIEQIKREIADEKNKDCGTDSVIVLRGLQQHHAAPDSPTQCASTTYAAVADPLPAGYEQLATSYMLGLYQFGAACASQLTGLQEWVKLNKNGD